jgi:hypothetical protein
MRRPLLRRLFRVGAKIGVAGGAACAAYLALLAHPEPLFAHSITYSHLTFYSQRPLPPEVAGIASAVARKLETSPWYDPGIEQRVFVVDRPWLWLLLNGPYRAAIARNVEIGDSILIPRLDVESAAIVHFDGRRAGAVPVLTHESVHTLVRRRIGVFRLWRLQRWQRGGYAEYVASDAATHSEAPPDYQRTARAWKYLLEIRHFTIDEVLSSQDSLEDVLSEASGRSSLH